MVRPAYRAPKTQSKTLTFGAQGAKQRLHVATNPVCCLLDFRGRGLRHDSILGLIRLQSDLSATSAPRQPCTGVARFF